MITRRALFSGSLAGVAFAANRAAACTATYPVYISTESDRLQMFAYARRFCSLFNRNEIEAIVNGGRNFNVALPGRSVSDEGRVPALRAFRETHGRILTPLSADNSLFWPEGARIQFIAAMELTPTNQGELLDWRCGAYVGGHDQWLFSLDFSIVHEIRRHRLDIGSASLTIGG
jgi:hypothetical protein